METRKRLTQNTDEVFPAKVTMRGRIIVVGLENKTVKQGRPLQLVLVLGES